MAIVNNLKPQLQIGSQGEAVRELQRLLGLEGSQVDGDFGPNTARAVEAFQRQHGLIIDGVVGSATWSALLGSAIQSEVPEVMVGAFDINRILGSIPFPNIRRAARTSLPLILEECQRQGVTLPKQVAYVLATAEHESHLGEFMVEFDPGFRYEGRDDLGNIQAGDGPRFKGRGFVQVTGRRNYTFWSQALGVDLVGNPERAAEPALAAKILVGGMRSGQFTGFKLADFLGDDFFNARKIINGLDRAQLIAEIAREYLKVLV